jgi:hypothetical protein
MTEGLYLAYFGSVMFPTAPNGGVAIFDTLRIYGGDSSHYYLGQYAVKDGHVTGSAKVVRYIPGALNVWGIDMDGFHISVEGDVKQDGSIEGYAQLDGTEMRVGMKLVLMEPLP